MADDIRIELTTGSPTAEQLDALRRLAGASQSADGSPPFSEQTLVELGKQHAQPERAPLTVARAFSAQTLLGAAVVVHQQTSDGEQTLTELTVHPDHRRQGVGTRLAARLTESVLSSQQGVSHRAWAHGGHDGGPKLAETFGWEPVRELWQMRLDNQTELPRPDLPAGVRLRSFRRGADEQTWLQANAEAFIDHPEQGQLTMEDLQARMAEDWFDAEGFLMAWEADEAEQEQLLGFHWTKVHPPERPSSSGVGEVYVVGVVPAAQGRGLGAQLTLAGIEHLRRHGVEAVILYVDASNAAAAGLYQKLGFAIWHTDVQYAPADTASPGSAAADAD